MCLQGPGQSHIGGKQPGIIAGIYGGPGAGTATAIALTAVFSRVPERM